MIHPAMNMIRLRTPQPLPHQKIHRWVAPTIHPPPLRNHWILSLNLKIARYSTLIFFFKYDLCMCELVYKLCFDYAIGQWYYFTTPPRTL